jgi:hypothetical protein
LPPLSVATSVSDPELPLLDVEMVMLAPVASARGPDELH